MWAAPTAAYPVEGGISPRYEAADGIVRLQLRESPSDGAVTRGRSEDARHLDEAAFDMTDLRIRQDAYELIAPVAKHEVIGAKSLGQSLGHVSKELIPGRMSSPVVHRLQTVDINERDH